MITQSITNSSPKIPLSINTGYIFVRADEIISIQSDGNCTTAHLLDMKQIKINTLLKHIEEELPSGFFRSHKSHIINMNYVSEYNIKEKFIIMEDESVIPLSRRRVADFNGLIRKTALANSN